MEINDHPNNITIPSFFNHSWGLYIFWKYFKHPFIESAIGDVDIIHALSWLTPSTKKAKKVVTIHDLTCLTHPECHPTWRVVSYKRLIKHSVENSDAILAVSESTKRDIVRYYGVDPDKITVTYNGINHQIFNRIDRIEDLEKAKRKYGITKQYVYYLGTIEPRKNVEFLIDAFLEANQKLGDKLQLVLSGKIGWKVEGLLQKIQAYSRTNKIIYTGYLSIQDTVALYNTAEVFVYPSLYEGFGLPIAEAMACGCPVITTDISSLPEVAGDAGILVDPYDRNGLAEAITLVVKDREMRKTMQKKSICQARRFTWENTAKVTRNVYKKLVSE